MVELKIGSFYKFYGRDKTGIAAYKLSKVVKDQYYFNLYRILKHNSYTWIKEYIADKKDIYDNIISELTDEEKAELL